VQPRRHHLDRHAEAIIEAAASGSDDDLLTTEEMAAWFRTSKEWLEIGRYKGYGPKFIKLAPQVVRYRRGDVKAWLLDRVHARTSEYC
jgi:predicted DNA-binding transcriptional regulator AlpA